MTSEGNIKVEELEFSEDPNYLKLHYGERYAN